jgi:SAM-dependent methyltransferase
MPHLGSRGVLRVLDYGGGNGKLLKPFMSAGHSCYLVDYNDNPISGVNKICDDMSAFTGDAFTGDDAFDLIICSHVLEHVSDLTSLATFFRRHLDRSGLLYAEVPQEIWAGLRLDADPVTHINFFTRNSLAGLFLRNGFDILESRQEVATYGNAVLEVLWILARPAERGGGAQGDSGASDARGGDASPQRAPGMAAVDLPTDVRTLLYPPRRATLRRMYELSLRPSFLRLRPER